jgi:hypothetical protein
MTAGRCVGAESSVPGDKSGLISYADGVPPEGGGIFTPSVPTPLPGLSEQSKISASVQMLQMAHGLLPAILLPSCASARPYG